MAITETAGAALGKRIGPLPVGGWAAIGIGTIVVVKLLRGGGGGGGGGGSDTVTIPDGFDPDGPTTGGGTTVPTPTVPTPTTPTAPAPTRYRLTILKRTPFYSTLGKIIPNLFGSSGTYDATMIKVGSRHYYRIKRQGVWRLIPVSAANGSTATVKVVKL